MSTHTLDLDARYRVDGWPKVAVYISGYVRTPLVDVQTGELVRNWLGECDEAYDVDRTRVLVVMVGGNREHEVDVEDLVPISDDEYCSCCGQIGCGWS